jgi:Flp pilus assembly protein TadG
MTALGRFAGFFRSPPLRRGFRRDARGVAAIEAALILPFAIALIGLLAIWAEGIAIQRKVTLTARTITDIVSQESGNVGPTNLKTDLSASSAVFAPYPNTSLTMVVSEVLVTGSGTTGIVQWSYAIPGHGTALGDGATVRLPSAIAAAGTYLIMGTVSYDYVPLVIGQTVGPTLLHDTIFLSPRQAASIPWSSSS